MPFFFIRTVNQHFKARDDGQEYADIAHGRRAAIAAAVEIGSEDINNGNPSVIIETFVEDEAGTVHAKVVVTMTIGDMQL